MAKTPTTIAELRNDCSLSEREALAASAILPNLPSGEALIAIRGYEDTHAGRRYFNTDADERDAFERRHAPIVPDGELYRTKVPESRDTGHTVTIEPVPHAFREYRFDVADIMVLIPPDVDDAGYDDTPQVTLDDFGFGSPFFNPHEANRDAFDRNPHLPV